MSDVRITILADDKASVTLQAAERRIEAVGRSAQGARVGVQAWNRSFNDLGNTVERGMTLMTRLDLVQITLAQSQNQVREAQERLSRAVSEFGANSRQAIEAQEDLANAADNLEKTNLRANLSFGLVAIQGVQMAASLGNVIPVLNALRAGATGAALAVGTLQIVSTIGAAAIGIVAGITALNAALSGTGSAARTASQRMEEIVTQVRDLEALRSVTADAPGLANFLMFDEADVQTLRALRLEARQNQRELFQEFQDGEARRQTLARGSAQAVTSLMQALSAERTELLRSLQFDLLSPSEFEGTVSRLRALDSALERANSRLQDIQGESRRAAEEQTRLGEEMAAAAERARGAWEETNTALAASLGGLGVNLNNLHAGTLARLSGSQGLGLLASRALETLQAERGLAREIVASGNPALLAQLNVSARKGETMSELAASIGLTREQEQALVQSGRLTTEGLLAQSQAAQTVVGSLNALQAAQAQVSQMGTSLMPFFRAGLSREQLEEQAVAAAQVSAFTLPQEDRAAAPAFAAVGQLGGVPFVPPMPPAPAPAPSVVPSVPSRPPTGFGAQVLAGGASGGLIGAGVAAVMGALPQVQVQQTFQGPANPAQVREATLQGVSTAVNRLISRFF